MSSTSWYEQNAVTVIPAYESLRAENVHSWLLGLLPDRSSLVLDIGAGSGREAAWLAGQGHEAIAVEPATAMREDCYAGGRTADPLRCRNSIDGRSPPSTAKRSLPRYGIRHECCWMHIQLPSDRERFAR